MAWIFHIPEADQFLMLDVYAKGEKSDLTPTEKKDLRELARAYKTMIIAAVEQRGKEQEL
jgi:hypothetical protein